MSSGTPLPLLSTLLLYSQACSPPEVACSRQQLQAYSLSQKKENVLLVVPAKVSGLMLIRQDWVPCLSLSDNSDSEPSSNWVYARDGATHFVCVNLLGPQKCRDYYSFHFTDEETEAQKSLYNSSIADEGQS